jgi:hypothetical protein
MTPRSLLGSSLRWAAAGAGLSAAAYAAYVGVTWSRYGRPSRPRPDERDELLDRFMPAYDIVERHHVRVDRPAAAALTVATEMNLSDVPAVRAVFKGRELLLGATADTRTRPRGLLAEVQSLGWVVLAETPGREIVVGAATKPWEANVTFRSLPAETFAAFDEPGYVKIAWTLRADPIGADASIFRTETRALATDDYARAKFRRYWSLLSPGILLIRRMMLGRLRALTSSAAGTQRHGPSRGALQALKEAAGPVETEPSPSPRSRIP